jgi:muramoyltetrapeptide carboxypeptidase LdcA involved in peptidoglycan recycling
MDHTRKSAEYVYQNPEKRAQDLMEAFLDPSIDAIISTIGGDDSIRIVPYIDFEIIRNNPKIFLGYSDSTITHFICYKA